MKDTRAHLSSHHIFGLAPAEATDKIKELIQMAGDGSLVEKNEDGFDSSVVGSGRKPPVIRLTINPITHLPMPSYVFQARASASPISSQRHLARGTGNKLLGEQFTYGIATIRTDIPKPLHPSITDQKNYGDEFSCKLLMDHEAVKVEMWKLIDSGHSF